MQSETRAAPPQQAYTLYQPNFRTIRLTREQAKDVQVYRQAVKDAGDPSRVIIEEPEQFV